MYEEGSTKNILSTTQIDIISEAVSSILSDFRLDINSVIKIRLTLEILLTRILDASDAPITCSTTFNKRFGKGNIIIEYDGILYNPIEDENDEFSLSMLKNMEVPCKWEYQNGKNYLIISVKKRKTSNTRPLFIAIVAALVFGFLSN